MPDPQKKLFRGGPFNTIEEQISIVKFQQNQVSHQINLLQHYVRRGF